MVQAVQEVCIWNQLLYISLDDIGYQLAVETWFISYCNQQVM